MNDEFYFLYYILNYHFHSERLLVQPGLVTPTKELSLHTGPLVFRSRKPPQTIFWCLTLWKLMLAMDICTIHLHVFLLYPNLESTCFLAWSFRKRLNHSHSIHLMVNNEEVGLIHLRLQVQGSITGTGIAVIHVNKGATGSGIIFSDVSGKSSFSGWKLN